MADKKVFRVYLTELFSSYVDTEATSADQAMRKIRGRLDDRNDPIQPIEDDRYYAGYQVDRAAEIDRDIADLE
jgi:hypothetical protein